MISKLSEKKKYLLFLAFVGAIGFASSSAPRIAFIWGAFFFFSAVYLIFKTKNDTGIAHYAAAYIMGAEVFFRMSWSGLPWEFGKYAIVVLLLLGMALDHKKRQSSYLFILYIFLLLPGVFLTFDYYNDPTMIKSRMVFNMGGPIVLTVSAIYFYRYKMKMDEFVTLSRWIVLGVFAMSLLVLTNVGDYSAVRYTYSSNGTSSGGFSGNQVSIAFGIGAMMLIINLVLKNRVFFYIWLDLLLLFTFIFQGLMTFSRGGISSAILAAVLGTFVFYFSNLNQIIDFLRKNFLKMLLGIAFATGTFAYVNDVTGGFLYARYFNVDSEGKKIKKDITTGRGEITEGDMMLFRSTDYMGVGVGISVNERPIMRNFAAHVEYTRMIAEHGILGILAMILMFMIPLKHFFYIWGKPEIQIIFTSSMLLALLTMTHAAMRLGMVGFFYGLAFILIVKKVKDV